MGPMERWGEGGFGGRHLHAVQIGLGTHGTFPECLTWMERDPCINWLMKAISDTRCFRFRGIVVEPVAEHVDRVRPLGEYLPLMRFVQAAISDTAEEALEMHVATVES